MYKKNNHHYPARPRRNGRAGTEKDCRSKGGLITVIRTSW